jgi:hypothetical protein
MPFAIPPLFILALGVMGAAVVVRWAMKETHRVNADLDRVRDPAVAEPARDALPTLKRDPATGEYRPD